MKKNVARQIVERFVGFHPDITEKERNEITPVLLIIILVSLGTTAGLISFLAFLIYRLTKE